jgi:hypothetical protein
MSVGGDGVWLSGGGGVFMFVARLLKRHLKEHLLTLPPDKA